MTVLDARGIGTHAARAKGKPPFELRTKLEIVVDESIVDRVVNTIQTLGGAGEIGAGMLFVIPVEDALRISTREAGKRAIF
jgi:nitrogen regulatory protein P-II 1